MQQNKCYAYYVYIMSAEGIRCSELV